MKRVLLATTALVAAGLLASNVAYAEDDMAGPVTVGLSGYTMGAIGFASDGSDTNRGHGVWHVYEFAVSGSSTLDNGIVVSVHTQLGTSGRPFDEQHITLSGTFGSLRVGRTESAAYNSTVTAPGNGIVFGFGVNNTWFNPATAPVDTYSGIGTQDAQRVVYTSPNFNGLTIALSYAPEADDSDTYGTPGRATNDAGQFSEHTAVGMNYSTDFMEGGFLTLGLGYEMATAEGGGADPEAVKAGLNVGFDQLVFGGGVYDHDSDGMQLDIGASWTEGATELGLQWGRNDGEDTDMVAAHLTYTLGPGVTVGAQVATGSQPGMDDVTQLMLGTAVFF